MVIFQLHCIMSYDEVRRSCTVVFQHTILSYLVTKSPKNTKVLSFFETKKDSALIYLFCEVLSHLCKQLIKVFVWEFRGFKKDLSFSLISPLSVWTIPGWGRCDWRSKLLMGHDATKALKSCRLGLDCLLRDTVVDNTVSEECSS